MRYPKIIMWWSRGNEEVEIACFDQTIEEGRARAIQFGYRPPVWYKPWQYFTGGLNILTVGFPKDTK